MQADAVIKRLSAVAAIAFAVASLSLSPSGTALIKQWEGTSQVAYLDVVGVPTICTGSTRNVFIGQQATLAECEQRLVEDTSYAGAAIKRHVRVKLTQGQYDALVSFTYNVGGGAFARSTLLRRLNEGACTEAAQEFLRWNRAGGKVLRGLSNRRAAERALFIQGCR